MLQWPKDCISVVSHAITKYYFFNPAHITIFQCLCDLWDSSAGVDLITFTQFLRDRKHLDAVGGPAFVTSLQLLASSPELVQSYIEIVRQKFLLREMIRTGTNMVRAAYGAQDDEAVNVIDDFDFKIQQLKKAAGGVNGSERFEFSDLMAFDSKHDPNCLVGNRYLVRGGSSLWAAGSGYGKSALALQLCVYWACGQSCFGLRPVRPIKSLIIQAENDRGDMAEQLQGVIGGVSALGDIDIEKSKESIEKNVGIHRAIGKIGSDFLALLETLIELDSPDMVWIDPLFAFAGCDLMNAEKTGYFLRKGLFPLAAKRGVALNVVHHVGKPVRDAKEEKPIAEIDYQYLGFGTSEIQNSFRAVNIIVPVATTGLFKLVLSKRGERAGAMDTEGHWSRSIFIKHSTEGICWLQADKPEPETKGGREPKFFGKDVLNEMSVTTGWGTRELQKHMKNETGMSEKTFYRLWAELKSEGKIRLDAENKWIKQPKKELK